MLLKFFVKDGSVLPGWNAHEIRGKTIFDLKVLIGKQFGIPILDLKIADRDTTLGDHFLVTKVAKICEELGVPEDNVTNENDLLAFCKKKLVCKMRILNTGANTGGCGEPTVMMDKTRPKVCSERVVPGLTSECSLGLPCDRTMEAVCPTQSNSTTTCNDEENSSSEVNPDEDKPCVEMRCEPYEGRPPYFNVIPEERQFGVVIEEGSGDSIDRVRFLSFVANHIKDADEAKILKFSMCNPLEILDNALLVECGNAITAEWMQRVSRPICPPYKFFTFIRYFELVRWCFTIPMPTGKDFQSIFLILEKQNPPLDTAKWCVINHTAVDPCLDNDADKDFFLGYPKTEVTVYIDQESVDFLSRNCLTLKFLIYHLMFRPCKGG